MDPLETEDLIEGKPLTNSISSDNAEIEAEPERCKTIRNRLVSVLLEPFQWLQMLSSQLDPSFIFGVVLIYGLSQGFSVSFFKVVTDYYWKDVQKLQPSAAQVYVGLYYIPQVMRPIWGLLTDVFPIKGYKRRPYLVISGLLGLISSLMIALPGKLPVVLALSCLLGIAASVAIAEVVIDACIATNSIEVRSLAPDMQSLCGVCSSAGALVGYGSSGVFVQLLGAKGALGILAIPPALIVGLGFFIYERRSSDVDLQKKKKVVEGLGVAIKEMYKIIRHPQIWKPSLYMFSSLALNISTQEGLFYWYTDPIAGPAFSQGFVGIIHAVGALASMVGVVIYHKKLKGYSFRDVLFLAQLLFGLTGMLDLIFINRWNLTLGIPDSFFVITEECVTRIITRIKWIPMIVMSTRLCPLGIEGAFFALFMCIDSTGQLCSKWGGGFILHVFHVTRHDFRNLWLVTLVRNLLRLATLGLIFLVPKANHLDDLIPSDVMSNGKSLVNADEDDDDTLELACVYEKNEA